MEVSGAVNVKDDPRRKEKRIYFLKNNINYILIFYLIN
jgi:hypothetical protein